MRLRLPVKSLGVQSLRDALGFRDTNSIQIVAKCCLGEKKNTTKLSGLKRATVTHIRNTLSDESGWNVIWLLLFSVQCTSKPSRKGQESINHLGFRALRWLTADRADRMVGSASPCHTFTCKDAWCQANFTELAWEEVTKEMCLSVVEKKGIRRGLYNERANVDLSLHVCDLSDLWFVIPSGLHTQLDLCLFCGQRACVWICVPEAQLLQQGANKASCIHHGEDTKPKRQGQKGERTFLAPLHWA